MHSARVSSSHVENCVSCRANGSPGCAFAACCADHGGGVLHGAEGEGGDERLPREGAILTVATG